MDASRPALYLTNPVSARPVVLTEQQRRVLNLLQSLAKGDKLVVEYQGADLCMFVARRAGKVSSG